MEKKRKLKAPQERREETREMTAPPAETVTAASDSPRTSCHAFRVYSPAGTSARLKVPSAPLVIFAHRWHEPDAGAILQTEALEISYTAP